MKKGREDAQADWESFATALGQQFFEDVVSAGIADMLINDPPRKLMAEELSWRRKRPELTNVVQLFVQGVCQVRHNCIHGEKFVGRDDWDRDATLVHEALEVLRLADAKGVVRLPRHG